MKKIAVLTDFSERSEHAARYALHLAQKIEADILLFNAFLVPADVPMAAQVAWPVNEYQDMKEDSQGSLKVLCKKLEKELMGKTMPGKFLPAITYQCAEGPVANAISLLENSNNVILMVLATHGADNITTFITGNSCKQIIDAAKVPLLIVPEDAPIKYAERLAFATDIAYDDIPYINALASLAKYSSAEIMITNVNGGDVINNRQEGAITKLKQNIADKLDYERVYYRSIPDNNVKRGLEWLIENVRFDMLVMVHRKTNFFESLFKSSITKKIAGVIRTPLMVYPYPAASIPNFEA